MHQRRRSPLVALPLIAITLIAFGMTRAAFAATPAGTGSQSSSSTITRMLQRAANRAAARKNVSVNRNTLHRAAAQSSSRRSMSRSSSAVSTASVADVRSEITRLVNIEREKEGLDPLSYNTTLETSAQEYAEHMRAESCFSHTECGSSLKERMHASGYYQGSGRSYYYGENIARGQDSAAEVMEDWMNSPPHREAIMSKTFLEIGIGKSGNYWVQHFGAVR